MSVETKPVVTLFESISVNGMIAGPDDDVSLMGRLTAFVSDTTMTLVEDGWVQVA